MNFAFGQKGVINLGKGVTNLGKKVLPIWAKRCYQFGQKGVINFDQNVGKPLEKAMFLSKKGVIS